MNRLKKMRSKSPTSSLKSRWQAWHAGKSPVLRFLVKFGLLMALYYGLLATTYCDRALYAYLEANAWFSNLILDALGQHTRLSGITIRSPQFAVTIQRGCDAVEPTWLFCAAVLSFRAPFVRKFLGILVGIFLLQALNLIRIVSLFWIGLHSPEIFNTVHLEIWPTAFILVAILLFIGWIEWSAKPISSHAAA